MEPYESYDTIHTSSKDDWLIDCTTIHEVSGLQMAAGLCTIPARCVVQERRTIIRPNLWETHLPTQYKPVDSYLVQ